MPLWLRRANQSNNNHFIKHTGSAFLCICKLTTETSAKLPLWQLKRSAFHLGEHYWKDFSSPGAVNIYCSCLSFFEEQTIYKLPPSSPTGQPSRRTKLLVLFNWRRALLVHGTIWLKKGIVAGKRLRDKQLSAPAWLTSWRWGRELLHCLNSKKKNQCSSTSCKPRQPRCLYFSHHIRGLFMSIKPWRIVKLCYCQTLTFWLFDCHFNFLRPYLNNAISDAAPVAMANCLPEINHARGD